GRDRGAGLVRYTGPDAKSHLIEHSRSRPMSESIGTTCVQGGYRPGDGHPPQLRIYQSTTWKFHTSDAMGRLFDLEEAGYYYTRLQNPTRGAVAAKIAELEGRAGAMLRSAGQAANFFAVFNIAGAGDHVVASSPICGGRC